MGSNIRIAINAAFTHDKPTGLSIYTHEILVQLLRNEEADFVAFSNSQELKTLYPSRVNLVSPLVSPGLGPKGHMMRLLWQQTILPLSLRGKNISLLYSTVPEGILFPFVNQVITVHDLIPLKFPESLQKPSHYYRYVLPVLLKNTQAVICDSESTRKDLLAHCEVCDKRVYVVHVGHSSKKFHPLEKGIIKKKYGITEYLLYVGDLRPYKNLERSIEAFGSLNLKDIKFVIVGKKDPRFYPALERKVNELSLKEKVLFMGYVPDEDLPSFYSEAVALVHPSLYEGFGLPLLEAMACGCPIVTSNLSSMPEVCGDAAYYVDPYSTDAIAEGMFHVTTRPQLGESLVRRGFERVKHFSWEKTASEVLKVLKQVSTQKKRNA
jgi:glycosyltransferase involved in cell wall biosynthesis